jgi:hypothetical protein
MASKSINAYACVFASSAHLKCSNLVLKELDDSSEPKKAASQEALWLLAPLLALFLSG